MQLPKRNNLAKVGNDVTDMLDIEDIRAPENYLQYNTYAPQKMLANITYDANSCTTCHLFTMHYSRFSQFVSSFTRGIYIYNLWFKRVSTGPGTLLAIINLGGYSEETFIIIFHFLLFFLEGNFNFLS